MAVVQMTSSAGSDSVICDADGLLLRRYLNGEQRAFAELMQSYSGPIFSYLTRSGVPFQEREDLFQDIFYKVHRAASSYNPDKKFKPWLFTIVVNTVRSHFRKIKVRSLVKLVDVVESGRIKEPGPDDVLEARKTARWLEKKIETLSLPQRECLLLCCVEQMEQKEVAKILGIPVNTVKTHLRRARIQLAKGLVNRNYHQQRTVRNTNE